MLIFLPLSSVQSRPRFCIINTDIFYSDAKWNYRGVILTQKKKLPCIHKYFQRSGNNKSTFCKIGDLQARNECEKGLSFQATYIRVVFGSGILRNSRRDWNVHFDLLHMFLRWLITLHLFLLFFCFCFIMKRQQKLSLFLTLKKLAVEPEKHEDGLDKDGGEAAGEVSLIMSVVQNYNSLTQTITEMTQFKMPCGTYMYDPFWLISRLNTAFLCKSKTLLSHFSYNVIVMIINNSCFLNTLIIPRCTS